MARFGGMSSETFSSARGCLSARGRLSAASIGLASILREQKSMPGANRMTVLLGLSSQSSPAASRTLLNSPVHSLASSPVESNGFLDVDDAEQKDEDMWEVDMCGSGNMRHLDPLQRHRPWPPHAYELGSTHAYTGTLSHRSYGPASQRHSGSHMHVTPPNQNISAVTDNTQFAHHQLVLDKSSRLIDAMPTHASGIVRSQLSPLSKVSDSQPHCSHTNQSVTPSQSIPRVQKHALYDSSLHAEHQSAPVNVPNWSKILQKNTSAVAQAVNFNSIEEVCEEDEEERLPPHVILAREYAHTQRMTASMCEGQGRTLKGRDMRRVRNAVWRQTGFAD